MWFVCGEDHLYILNLPTQSIILTLKISVYTGKIVLYRTVAGSLEHNSVTRG